MTFFPPLLSLIFFHCHIENWPLIRYLNSLFVHPNKIRNSHLALLVINYANSFNLISQTFEISTLSAATKEVSYILFLVLKASKSQLMIQLFRKKVLVTFSVINSKIHVAVEQCYFLQLWVPEINKTVKVADISETDLSIPDEIKPKPSA